MDIKIDTSGIAAAGKAVAAAMEVTKNLPRQNAHTQLGCFKMKTMPLLGQKRSLSEEDRVSATKLVAEMQANNWLTEADIQWCYENGIPLN